MRIIYHIGFTFSEDDWTRGRHLLREVGRPDIAREPRSPFGNYSLALDEQEAANFRAAFAAHGFAVDRLRIRREHHYSAAELHASGLLCLRDTKPPTVIGGPETGTLYALDGACTCCGSGARQISPLLVAERSLAKRSGLLRTQTGEWLASSSLHGELEGNVKGLEFRQAMDRGSEKLVAWFQILPEREMSPFASTTKGVVRAHACECCHRDGFFHTLAWPLELHYPAQECAGSSDAVFTWERFGNSALADPFRDSHIAQPLMLVSRHFYSILRRLRIRGLEFVPVFCDADAPAAPGT